MKDFFGDLFHCFKLSLLIFLIPFSLGALGWTIGGLVSGKLVLKIIAQGGMYVTIWVACFGLFICAVAFVRVNTLRPLNYEEQWKQHFKKMNLVNSIFFVSFFIMVYGFIIDIILRM